MRNFQALVLFLVSMSVANAETTVRLGSPALTAGIPGSGPLTLEQVESWLATRSTMSR